jgi:hypothetical protein
MVHREPSEGKKAKPRGRPFLKGNKRGKLTDKVLASSGRESCVEGGVVAPALESTLEDTLNHCVNAEMGGYIDIPEEFMEAIQNQIVKEPMEIAQEELTQTVEPVKEEAKKEERKDLETIESIDFKNGENTLSIRFSKRHNRMFRIQVFINNENEIRPVTYTGASTGYAFWNLLKGALRK